MKKLLILLVILLIFSDLEAFKDVATKGKNSMGWYAGFKLHLLCNEKWTGSKFQFAVVDFWALRFEVISALYMGKGMVLADNYLGGRGAIYLDINSRRTRDVGYSSTM